MQEKMYIFFIWFTMLPSTKKIVDLAHNFNNTLSMLMTKRQNCIPKKTFFFFEFLLYGGEWNKIKVSKNQSNYPTYHSLRIFYVFAFSVHTKCLNIEFYTYFQITFKNKCFIESLYVHRRCNKKNISDLTNAMDTIIKKHHLYTILT